MSGRIRIIGRLDFSSIFEFENTLSLLILLYTYQIVWNKIRAMNPVIPWKIPLILMIQKSDVSLLA